MNNLKNLLVAYKDVKEGEFLKCSSKCFLASNDSVIEKGLLKSLIIAIYAAWENYVKSRILDFYRENKKYLYNKDFLKKYLEGAISNSYTRNVLLDSFVIDKDAKIDFDIKKEILCASNNMTIEEFMNILKRLCLDIDELKREINNGTSICFVRMRYLLDELWKLGLNIQKVKKFESLKAFFEILIDARNSISHTFICDDSFTSEQLEIFIEIIISIRDIINRYFDFKQIELKFKAEQEKFNKITMEDVIKSNKGKGNYTAILHIKSGENKFRNNDLMIIRNSTGTYSCRILNIRDKERIDMDIVEYNQDYTLEIDTDMSIDKSSKLEIFCENI